LKLLQKALPFIHLLIRSFVSSGVLLLVCLVASAVLLLLVIGAGVLVVVVNRAAVSLPAVGQ
jgi:hypothetical protein